MTPFAGVGVNVAMKDALQLAHAICEPDRVNLSDSLRKFEVEMWKRAKSNAEATMMYLDLFFNERGGVAMVEYFAQKLKERAHQWETQQSIQTANPAQNQTDVGLAG